MVLNPDQERSNQILQIHPRKATLPYNNMIYFRGLKSQFVSLKRNGFGRKRNERVTTNKRKTITNKTVNKIYENLFTCSNIGLS